MARLQDHDASIKLAKGDPAVIESMLLEKKKEKKREKKKKEEEEWKLMMKMKRMTDGDRGEEEAVKSLPLTAKTLVMYHDKGKGRTTKKQRTFRTSSWSGNTNSDGTVDSGALDEDVCFECGESTTDFLQPGRTILICDMCEGEYHLACVQLDLAPRHGWECPACTNERRRGLELCFDVEGECFEIPPLRRHDPKPEWCYSPSRPIEKAWPECVEKGFMTVKQVFTYDIMKKLTHGTIQSLTTSGRVAAQFDGAVNEFPRRIRDNNKNVAERAGRYDLRLPDYVVEQLGIIGRLQPILDRLMTIMGLPKPFLRTHNVVFSPVGSVGQDWHVDDTIRQGKVYRYFTILIHLNSIDDRCGGTEIWSDKLQRSDLIRARPGDAFVFNGSLMHRGTGNEGRAHRFFYYAAFSCRVDANADAL